MGYGPVKRCGADPPNGRNYKQYLDEKEKFNNLKFLSMITRNVPRTLNVTVQCEVSRRVVEVEVGCERLQGLSGYVLQPRRNTLDVQCNAE